MALKTEATSIFRRQLPSIQQTNHQEGIEFKPEDINKIIEQIVSKGNKYSNLKKTLSQQQVNSLPGKLTNSNFIKIMVRKVIIKMGEQRRLGNSLRGFSKLLLEEIQAQCWPLILIERSLLQLQRKQSRQLEVLGGLLDKNT